MDIVSCVSCVDDKAWALHDDLHQLGQYRKLAVNPDCMVVLCDHGQRSLCGPAQKPIGASDRHGRLFPDLQMRRCHVVREPRVDGTEQKHESRPTCCATTDRRADNGKHPGTLYGWGDARVVEPLRVCVDYHRDPCAVRDDDVFIRGYLCDPQCYDMGGYTGAIILYHPDTVF